MRPPIANYLSVLTLQLQLTLKVSSLTACDWTSYIVYQDSLWTSLYWNLFSASDVKMCCIHLSITFLACIFFDLPLFRLSLSPFIILTRMPTYAYNVSLGKVSLPVLLKKSKKPTFFNFKLYWSLSASVFLSCCYFTLLLKV